MRLITTQLRWLGVGALLFCGAAAYGADTYSAGKLTIPTLVIGNATYTNVVVTVGSILSGPAGTSPIGTVDTYNPANGQLIAQAVTFGPATLYNVIVTVSGLVSVGSVSGADTYDGHTVTSGVFLSFTTYMTKVSFTPTGAPTIAGGMPSALNDSLNSGILSIPALEYAGRVFTNISVPATQGSATTSDQSITFSKPVYSVFPLKVGASEAILATASSGLPVSYVVQTPTICAVVEPSAQEGYGYISYSAAGGSGSGVVGAAPVGTGAFQANWFSGTDGLGNPLGLSIASSAINPLPSNSPYYTAPYSNFNASNEFAFDDVLYTTGAANLDPSGILLTSSDDQYINPYFFTGPGYQFVDSHIFADQGNPQPMTWTASIVSGLVGLADGACVVTAFQPGNGSFSAAAPVSVTVDVGVTILP